MIYEYLDKGARRLASVLTARPTACSLRSMLLSEIAREQNVLDLPLGRNIETSKHHEMLWRLDDLQQHIGRDPLSPRYHTDPGCFQYQWVGLREKFMEKTHSFQFQKSL